MSLIKNRMSICNFICVLLLIAIICVQLFVPFYNYNNTYKDDNKKEVKEASWISYGKAVWFTKDKYVKSLAEHFGSDDMFGEVNKHGEPYGKAPSGANLKFNMDEMAYPHLYAVILGGFSLVFFLLKRKSFIPSALSVAAGIITTKAFLTNRTIVIGSLYPTRVVNNPSVCTINVVLGVLLICVALFSLFGGFALNPLQKKLAAKKAAKAAATELAEVNVEEAVEEIVEEPVEAVAEEPAEG